MRDSGGDRRDVLKWATFLGALGLLGPSGASPAEGRDAAARGPGGAGIVGSWIVRIHYHDTAENAGSRDARKRTMAQFTADGRWIGSESALEPDSTEAWTYVWQQATYHGEWVPKGDGTVEVKGRRLYKDGRGGMVAITFTTIEARLGPDGDGWEGAFETTTFDPEGTALGSFTGSLEGRRVSEGER